MLSVYKFLIKQLKHSHSSHRLIAEGVDTNYVNNFLSWHKCNPFFNVTK